MADYIEAVMEDEKRKQKEKKNYLIPSLRNPLGAAAPRSAQADRERFPLMVAVNVQLYGVGGTVTIHSSYLRLATSSAL